MYIDHICVCASTVAYLVAAETSEPEACEKVLGFGFLFDATHAIWHSPRTAKQGGWQPAARPQTLSVTRMDTQVCQAAGSHAGVCNASTHESSL